jgi:hypothetical protein
MEIKNSEWTEFAEFIANCSTHMVSQYWEDGTYTCCPFSTIERAYAAFSVWKTSHSSSEIRKFYDVDYMKSNPEYDALEEFWRQKEEEENEYYAYLQKQEEIEECYEQQYPDCTWQDEWDTYIPNRKKQITRIAHELADKYGELPFVGKKSCASLVLPFFKKYELNSDERWLFIYEYFTQLYLNCNHHV